ncbi:uncharacterized protein BDV17DRAFT_298399 [Aspergillus undulatus]|uniref:uncharacterized protein n=1 Tax=Aspergillus undulatus TaxID=1810928 RepID=UPI003CCD358C
MRLSILAIVLTTGAAFAQDESASTTAAPTVSDVGQLPSQLSQLANLLPTLPPNWELPSSVRSLKDSLPTPPPGILTDLVNGVPTTVLRGLVNPASRSALQESVANGDSPQWYQDLPTPVKSYIGLFASQIADRSLTYNPTAAVATNASTVEASTGDGDSDGQGDGESWDLGEAEDDDSGARSAFDGKSISTSLSVVMGILGLAVAL